MPSTASSAARQRVRCSTAALVIEYSAFSTRTHEPTEEPKLTIAGAGERRRAGSAAWIKKKTLRTLVATCSSNSASVNWSNGFATSPAALLINTSMRPRRESTCSTISCGVSAFETSAGSTKASLPAASISRATPASFSSLRPTSTTTIPLSANRRAVAAPIPEPAPVTMATGLSVGVACIDGPFHIIRICSLTYNFLGARGDAGTYPSHQRCCAASASHSGETQGDASPPPVRTSPAPTRLLGFVPARAMQASPPFPSPPPPLAVLLGGVAHQYQIAVMPPSEAQ